MSTGKEESEARIGTFVDAKWHLEALIGYSAMAATFKARHRNGLEMAVRIMHRSHAEFETVVARFLEEAAFANRIAHAGVERILDDGMTEDGCPYLVMELLEGETLELRRMAAGGQLSFLEAVPIVDGMLEALVAIHDAGVVHRNLKPGNVFLARSGQVVLTDLGRARVAEDIDLSQPFRRSLFSVENLVTGTPAYMAPEQARGRGEDVDARADIWSAGAIMFTLLTGKRIHDAPTPQEKLHLAQTQAAPPLRSVFPEVSEDIAMVVDRALAFDRVDRWASADGMRRAYWLATGRETSVLPKVRRRLSSLPPPMEEVVEETNPLDVQPQKSIEEDPVNYQDLAAPPIDAFWAAPQPKKKRKVWRYVFLVLLLVGGGVAAKLTYPRWSRYRRW